MVSCPGMHATHGVAGSESRSAYPAAQGAHLVLLCPGAELPGGQGVHTAAFPVENLGNEQGPNSNQPLLAVTKAVRVFHAD